MVRFSQLVALVFLVAGLGVCARGAWDLHLLRQARTWPTTPGRITRVRLVHPGSDGPSVPDYRYRYAVSGKRYVSDRVQFGIPIALHGLVLRYSEGQRVDVFYDPADPGSAVLRPRLRDGIHVVLGAGAALLVVGLLAARGAAVRKARAAAEVSPT